MRQPVDAFQSAGNHSCAKGSTRRAEHDGLRWTAAAGAAFTALDRQNRYAMLFRIQTARKPETRTARIAKLVGMPEHGEEPYP